MGAQAPNDLPPDTLGLAGTPADSRRGPAACQRKQGSHEATRGY